MPRKAWVITSEEKIVDVLNARKKISYIDEYLCDLFAQTFGGDYQELKALIAHPTGQETFLEKNGKILRAKLDMVDDITYDRFDKSEETDW